MKKIVALLIASVMCVSFAVTASAGEGEVIKMQCALAAANMEQFDVLPEIMSEATNGQIEVELVDITNLGTSEDALRMVQNGAVAMYMNSPAQTPSFFPVLDLLQIPFYTGNIDNVIACMAALDEAGLLEELHDGFEPLSYIATDPQMLSFASKKVESLADFTGLNVRAVSGISVKMLQELGANVVTMGFAEVVPALEKGTIDGVMTSPIMMYPNHMEECLKYTLDLSVFNGPALFLINKNIFDSLTPELQEAVKEVGKTMQEHFLTIQEEQLLEYWEAMEAAGLERYTPSDEFIADLQATTDTLIEAEKESLDQQGYDAEAIFAITDEVIGR